jgi:hypothetical protein
MRTSFIRPDAPLWMRTADRATPKCLATSATSSSLAFPSTGGERSSARQDPSACCTSALLRAFGLTLTWRVMATDAHSTTRQLAAARQRTTPVAHARAGRSGDAPALYFFCFPLARSRLALNTSRFG